MPTVISKKKILALNTTEANQSDGFESPSPHPPSSPSDDSDSIFDDPPSSKQRIYTSIDTAPDCRLREILIKLVNTSPEFRHAIAKELSSPNPPAKRGRQHRRRSTSESSVQRCANCGRYLEDGHEECGFHPGQLQEEIYEFLSRTPEGIGYKVARAITMWSCCAEDARSPGCMVAPAHVDPHRQIFDGTES